MKKIGMLFAFVLVAACGGSDRGGGAQEPVAAAPTTEETASTPVAETTTADPMVGDPADPAGDQATDRTLAAGGVGADPTAPAPTEAGAGTPGTTGTAGAATPTGADPATAQPMSASAELKSVKDDTSMGTLTFTRGDDGKIAISGSFTGLKKKGAHALYIHENGDCSNKAKNVGKHLNPTNTKHGPPSASKRHAGDFGNVTADDTGTATFAMETDSVTMEPGRADSILDRAVVIYSGKDTKSGKAGTPIACGVITAGTQ